MRTSRCELGALAGAAVIVSVLGAELGAGVGEAARPAGCATEVLGMKAGLGGGRNRVLTSGSFLSNLTKSATFFCVCLLFLYCTQHTSCFSTRPAIP